MSDDISHFERAYRREKQARKELEDILEAKTRDLHETNQRLNKYNEELQWNHSQMVQSEKMASLGQMAAGIAHEINNPVGFVLSNFNTLLGYVTIYQELVIMADDLMTSVNSDDLTRAKEISGTTRNFLTEKDISFVGEDSIALLEETREGLVRIRDIVAGLKSFAHVDEADQKVANINEGIESTLKLVWNEIKYKCTVFKDLGALPDLMCFPGQLNQVFMNLLVNAAQAIEQSGEIKIKTWADHQHVHICIADNGPGIDPEHINKLFNPFFTTKPIGKGTGLGLSISYGIIQRHHGKITVKSELGKGAEFLISLPLHVEPANQ